MLDKIYRQNSLILKKIDQILSSQNNMENRIKKLEDDNINKNKFDESFVNVIYKITLLCIKTLYMY